MGIFGWLSEPQYYLVCGIHLSSRLFVIVSQSYIAFYVQYTVELSAGMIAIAPLVKYIAGIITSFVLKLLTDKVGYKRAFVLSCVLGLGISTLSIYEQIN